VKYEVGDLIVPADGSSYVGRITYISEDEDTVRHKCLKTGTEYEKSYYGFPVRYMSIVEMLEWSRKLSKENALHTKLILAGVGDEAVRAAVANTDARWRMEQEVIVRQRDEALLNSYTSEREIDARRDRDIGQLDLTIVGLDIMGEYLPEVNVTSPTSMVEIFEQTGENIAAKVIEAVVRG
jgi:hypothetical protein